LGGALFYVARRPVAPSVSVVPTPAPVVAAAAPASKRDDALVPETVPFIPDGQLDAIRTDYLPAPSHKALAISFNRLGMATSQSDDDTAKAAALDSCTRATMATGSNNQCLIYAVGNTVVFPGRNPPMPPLPWFVRNPAVERPFAGSDVPFLSASSLDWANGYSKAKSPKAMAISSHGNAFYYRGVASEQEGIRRSLQTCGYLAGIPCIVVALNDSFVVPVPVTMKAVGFFNAGNDTRISPELRSTAAERYANAPNSWNAAAIGANGRLGLALNAADEKTAVENSVADCSKQDRDCRVIAIGPFTIEPAGPSK